MYFATKNGVEKRIESWKIIIPLKDNQKQPFSEKIIDSIKSKIISEFGGFTSINVVGHWKSGKTSYIDKNIMIITDIPVKEHEIASKFFIDLKHHLMKKLGQEKIYITLESEKSELLSINEFLQELGFEVTHDQPQELTQDNIEKLTKESGIIDRRLSYKTLNLIRDRKLGKIKWEREILGIKIVTEIEDNFPKDAIILSADNLEKYFSVELFGKNLIIFGDYEYQSFILDKKKRRFIVGEPNKFSQYDEGDKEPLYGPHDWHGTLRTSEFIPTFVEQILINYIILRESGVPRDKISINVGSDGSMQMGNAKLMFCPAPIPDKKIQKVIIENLHKAIELYESGSIDEIGLMQAKVLNRYNEKKAMMKISS